MNKRELISEMGFEDYVLLEPDYLDAAIVGMSHDGRVIYDYDLLVQAFVDGNEDWTTEDAIEWIDYNTIRSLPYMQNSPIILYGLPQCE